MTSETLQDMQGLKAAGKVVGYTIAEMKKKCSSRYDDCGAG
ncbi:hypothetical protein ACFTAO_17800 [Paenibacillus rhizoplanae]